MKITRRHLAVALASTATALAQTQPPATADEELKAARDRLRANSETLARQEIPMALEPAFLFKA